jgi:hypothetical protein
MFGSKQHKYLKKLEFETLLYIFIGSIIDKVEQSNWVIAENSLFWDRVNSMF